MESVYSNVEFQYMDAVCVSKYTVNKSPEEYAVHAPTTAFE
jgi:hypothetical protein